VLDDLIDSKKILPERNRSNRNSLTNDLFGSVKDVDLMMMMRQKLDAQNQREENGVNNDDKSGI